MDRITRQGHDSQHPGIRSGSPAADQASSAAIAAVCLAEIMSLAAYSAVPALLPQFIAGWSLSNTEAGWLSGMIFAGYMLAVLPLVALTDRWPARSICLASMALNVLACIGFAASRGLALALVFRGLAGIALAGIYMPGLRALAGNSEGKPRARIVAWYTSAFTIGASLSFFAIGRVGMLWGWRSAFLAAGGLGLAGAVIAWIGLPAIAARGVAAVRTRIDFPAALANREALMLTIAYAAVIWGAAGLRHWIVVFLDFAAGHQATAIEPAWLALAAGGIIGLLGGPGGIFGNEIALRFGLGRTALWVFLVSAAAIAGLGLADRQTYGGVLAFSLVCGLVLQCNFSNLTAGIMTAARPDNVGATVGLYSFVGFGGGFVAPLAFGFALDRSGGTSAPAAWAFAFATSAFGCLVGAAAMALYSRRHPAALKPRNGPSEG